MKKPGKPGFCEHFELIVQGFGKMAVRSWESLVPDSD
jgi:hypothetical protein